MELINKNQNTVDTRITLGELLILNNGLNEVCNGIDKFEFETRMGASVGEVTELLKKIGSIIDNLEENEK